MNPASKKLKSSESSRLSLTTAGSSIICGIGRCICRRHRHSGIRCDPERRRSVRICRHPVGRQRGRGHAIEVFARSCFSLQHRAGRWNGKWRTAARISTRPQPYTLFGGPAVPHCLEEIKCAALFKAVRLPEMSCRNSGRATTTTPWRRQYAESPWTCR